MSVKLCAKSPIPKKWLKQTQFLAPETNENLNCNPNIKHTNMLNAKNIPAAER